MRQDRQDLERMRQACQRYRAAQMLVDDAPPRDTFPLAWLAGYVPGLVLGFALGVLW